MLSAQHVHEPPLHTVFSLSNASTQLSIYSKKKKKRKINVFKGYNTNKCPFKNLTVKAKQ